MKAPLLLLTALLFATSGWSYTYIINDTDPAPAGTGLPIKWPAGTFPLRIMLGTDKTLSDGTTYSSSAQAAAQTWNAVLGNLQFQTQIIAAGSAGNGNHVNELVFANDVFGKAFGSGVLAITTTWYSGNERTEADTIFDQKDWTWDSYRGPRASGTIDIQRVAIHELGHSLGLAHPDEAGQTVTAIMNSHVSSIDTLTNDDLTGAQNLYGPPGVPANDNFANATTLNLDSSFAASVAGYNTNATKEPGEPKHAGDASGHSVWWKWTAPTAGNVKLDTRGSYLDTTLAVYTGTAVASLTAVASNDDINPGIVQASSLTFTATANTTYFIAVDGFAGDEAGITLNLSFTSTATTPAIITQPASQTVNAGDNASFNVIAVGSGTLTYQWFFGSTAISGATGATLSLTNVQTANAGTYFVTVANTLGSINSSTATLTVNAATPLAITTQPANQTVTAGTNASFSVTATGSGTLTYQWFFGSTAITGATSATLSLTTVQPVNAGSYSVTVTSSQGSINSNPATLTVNSTPAPNPTPTPSGGGGGGGGGAPSVWFLASLSLLALGRLLRSRP